MSCFGCLPIVEKPVIFTTLEDASYCGALFSAFALITYTIGPLSTLAEYCFEEESSWQALTRYYGNFMQFLTLVLFIISACYIYGIKKKKQRLITLYMFFVFVNCIALLIYAVLLLSINIISSDAECDFPNINCKDVVVRTSIKIVTALFFVTVYAYILIVSKSYILTFPKKPEPKRKSRDIENPPLRIKESDTNVKR